MRLREQLRSCKAWYGWCLLAALLLMLSRWPLSTALSLNEAPVFTDTGLPRLLDALLKLAAGVAITSAAIAANAWNELLLRVTPASLRTTVLLLLPPLLLGALWLKLLDVAP